MAGSTTDNGVMAADTAAAGTAECTTAARAGSTGTPDAAYLGHGEAAEGALACTRNRRRPNRWIEVPALDACGAVPAPEPSPYRMNRASSRSAPEKKSRLGSRGAYHLPPDLGSECPPADGTQPSRHHPLLLVAHSTTSSWTCPHPSTGYPSAALAPFFCGRGHRAAGLSAPSPEWQLRANHPATTRL
ncbi:hypothetical protein PIB30_097343 [Stylosanthes scabra]|uniref:Uncharacterized protein n=1 Tax=Stylosanthes scabra TaxID=79078 RepID=A0ABU6QVL6_9FABA|nr:hypothetical protein [Stylosanthes scabra]